VALGAILLVLGYAAGLPFGVRAVAALVTVVLAVPPLHRVIGLRGPHAVRAFQWDEAGRWRVRDGAGHWYDAELLPPCAIAGPLVLLAWRVAGRRRLFAAIDACTVPVVLHRRLEGRLRTWVPADARRRADGN